MKLASVRSLASRHGGGVFGSDGKSTKTDLLGRIECETDTTRAVQNGILI